MTSGTVEIGPISPEHFERWDDIRRQAFGGTDAYDAAFYEAIPADRVRGASVDGVLCAAVVTHSYEQTWGGVAVPCGGLSGVVVAPEARGRGLARRLVQAHLDQMSERGQVVSVLYPTTASLYRSLGYEMAGAYAQRAIPHTSVPTGPADDLVWERVRFDDARIVEVDARAARSHTGLLTVEADTWTRRALMWEKASSSNRYAYVGLRDGEPVAAVVYLYVKPEHASDPAFYQLQTDVLAAADRPAWQSVLAFLAMQSTTSSEIRTSVPAAVLAPHLPHLQRSRVIDDWPWMLRLVDVAGAVAARPAPTSVSGFVSLSIVDDALPANTGAWTLEVAGGKAALTPGGAGAVSVTVQTLAQIYAGADVRTLAASGLLSGATADDCDLLATTFVGSPHLQFFF